jgi:membrane-associated phospholipid phosphatase
LKGSGFFILSPPYSVRWGNSLPIAGIGVGSLSASWILKQRNPPLNTVQLAGLNPQKLPAFDRFAVYQYHAGSRKWSDILLYTSPLWPGLLLLDPAIRKNIPTTFAIGSQAVLLSAGLTALTKEIALRPRPYTYNANVPLDVKTRADARKSFFSGHTSSLAAITFVSARIWTDHHPNSRWKPWVWTGAALLPISMGALRVSGGKHFPSDVFTGLLIGAVSGILVPGLMKN